MGIFFKCCQCGQFISPETIVKDFNWFSGQSIDPWGPSVDHWDEYTCPRHTQHGETVGKDGE